MSDSASEPSNIVCHPKGKSKVWKYFGFVVDAQGKILNDKKVCCRLCKHELGYSGNTTNLFYHSEKEHPDENTIVRSESTSNVPPAKSKQPTMETMLVNSTPYSKSSPRYQQLLTATVDFICYGLHAVSTVDDPSFRNLLSVADKRYAVPSRTQVSRKLIPEKYAEVRTQIQRELELARHVSITTDLWTSQHQHRAYISVIAHFINGFKFMSRCPNY